MNTRRTSRLFLVVAAGLALAATLHAETDAGAFDAVAERFRDATRVWQATFLKFAHALFWTLAAIDLTWTGITLALRNSDIHEVVSEIVRQILIIGFFAALLMNATVWMPAIVDSFRMMATEANAVVGVPDAYQPSTIFDICLQAADQIVRTSLNVFLPGNVIIGGLVGLGVLIVGSLIAATMLVTLCEMYIVLNVGLVMLGFGGSRWTRDYSTKLLSYTIGVGLKLMLIQLIVGLGQSFVEQTAVNVTKNVFNFEESTLLLVTLTVLLALVRSLPSLVQALVTGGTAHMAGTGAIAAAATLHAAAQGAGPAATVLAGGAGAVAAAAKLAVAQGTAVSTGAAAASAATPAALGLGASVKTGVDLLSRAAGNLAMSAGRDISSSFSGDKRTGSMGHRMAADMHQQTIALKTAATQPLQPGPGENKT